MPSVSIRAQKPVVVVDETSQRSKDGVAVGDVKSSSVKESNRPIENEACEYMRTVEGAENVNKKRRVKRSARSINKK